MTRKRNLLLARNKITVAVAEEDLFQFDYDIGKAGSEIFPREYHVRYLLQF